MQRDHYTQQRQARDGSKLRIGIVVSEFNHDITFGMLDGALETLSKWKVAEKNIKVKHVPGGFELPLGCKKLMQQKLKGKKFDALIALGCILKGETKHDEYIANAVAQGLTQLQLETGTPIAFGVLTPNTLAQAQERSRGKTNKGIEAALASLEMALF